MNDSGITEDGTLNSSFTESTFKKKERENNVEGLKLELNMWMDAYKTLQANHQKRVQKLLHSYNEKELALKKQFLEEKEVLFLPFSRITSEMKKMNQSIESNMNNPSVFLNNIKKSLEMEGGEEGEEEEGKVFLQLQHNLLEFVSSLNEGGDFRIDKEKEIDDIRNSKTMLMHEHEENIRGIKSKLLEKEKKVREQREEINFSLKNIKQLQESLKVEKERSLMLERKCMKAEDELFKKNKITSINEKEYKRMKGGFSELIDRDERNKSLIKEMESIIDRITKENKKELKERDDRNNFLNVSLKKQELEKQKLEKNIINYRTSLNVERERHLKIEQKQKKELKDAQIETIEMKKENNKMKTLLFEMEKRIVKTKEEIRKRENLGDAQLQKIISLENDLKKIRKTKEIMKQNLIQQEKLIMRNKIEYQNSIISVERKISEECELELSQHKKTIDYLKSQLQNNKNFEAELRKTASEKIKIYENRLRNLEMEKKKSDGNYEKEIRLLKNEMRGMDNKVKERMELFRLNNENSNGFKRDKVKKLISDVNTLRHENLKLRDKVLDISEKLVTKNMRKNKMLMDEMEMKEKIEEERSEMQEEVRKEKPEVYGLIKENSKLKSELVRISRKYKAVKDAYIKQMMRENDLQNCLLKMSQFSTYLDHNNVTKDSINRSQQKKKKKFRQTQTQGFRNPKKKKKKIRFKKRSKTPSLSRNVRKSRLL